jgi:hypothetical protein
MSVQNRTELTSPALPAGAVLFGTGALVAVCTIRDAR